MDDRASAAPDAAYGDADVAQIAAAFGEPSRARILVALADGRALPASMLAAEAGLSPPATSAQLARLRDAGLVVVEPSGRHRYYRLASPDVATVLEAMARLAQPKPIRSLTEGTRAQALRAGRTCYDHLAGKLGTEITGRLLNLNALVRTDGLTTVARRQRDHLSSPVAEHPYRLGQQADKVFGDLGVDLAQVQVDGTKSRRPLLRFCLDWTEQQHHLAGRLGAAVFSSLVSQTWVSRAAGHRAVRLTGLGARMLAQHLGSAERR